MNVQQIDLTGKSILHVFNKIEFKIEIQTSLQIVYLKRRFLLKNKSSNHPPKVLTHYQRRIQKSRKHLRWGFLR